MADPRTQIIISARDETRAAFAAVEQGMAGLTAAASRLPIIGAALAGLSFTGIVKGAIDSAAALDDMAEITGASVENLSKLQAVAKVSGIDMGVVEGAMVRLTKALAGADDESKGAAKALAAIGLSMQDLRQMDSADALTAVALALNKYEDGAGKTAAAIAILGKNGAQALPYLKDLAEAGTVNATVTAQQAAEAEKLQKSWNRMTNDVATLARTIVMDLVPALQKLTGMANQPAVGVGGALSASLDRALVGGNLQARIRELQDELDAREKARATPGSLTNGGLIGTLAGISDEGLRRRIAGLKELASAEALVKTGYGNEGRAAGVGAKGRLDPGMFAADKGGAGKKAAALGSVQDYEMRIGEMVGNAIGNADIIKAAEYAAVQARLLDMLNKGQISEELYAGALMKTSHAQGLVSDEAERFNKLLAATPSAKIEEQRKDMQMLAAALEAGRISEQEFIEATSERLGLLGDGIKEVDDFARQLGLTFSSAFEDAVISGKNLSDVLKGLAQDVARIFLRKTVTEPMAGALSDMFKGFDFAGLFGGGRASGGAVSAGRFYVVGENGPELFAPGQSGTIVPNGGGGGVTVNLIEAPGKGGQVRERSGGGGRVLDITVESIKAAVAQDIMRGAGPVPAAMQAAYGLGRVGSA